MQAFLEFWKARGLLTQIPESGLRNTDCCSSTPPVGVIKIICDGAYEGHSKNAGIGKVVRDFHGMFLTGWCGSIVADSGFLAELKAVKKALELSSYWPGVGLMLEVDCESVTRFLNFAPAIIYTYVIGNTSLYLDIWDILVSLSCVTFSLTRRGENLAANCLAGLASRELESVGSVFTPRPPLALVLLQDSMNVPLSTSGQYSVATDREGICSSFLF
ncbi:uncharacterized protein LOC129318359 [Prosopis cineraria]|uniref:uncharacterized protein LOC129318359 n=1 Tax=Prosopis cineraria TaxID=364024 RepID=UPI00240ED8EF|nr:uncharacterized protein LOC129318359 [Prosopis cineraria]